MLNKRIKRKLELKAHQFFKGMSKSLKWAMLICLAPAVLEFNSIPKEAWLTSEALPVFALLGIVGIQFLFLLYVETSSDKNIARLNSMPS